MKYRNRMPGVDIFMGLGATIDFEAGTLKRAPAIWQKIGMEWLYRCMKEPKRLFKRYFIDDMQFFLLLYLAIAWNIQKSLRQKINYLRKSLQNNAKSTNSNANK